MQPKSKFGRLVYTNVLIDAGVMLMAEADATPHRSALARARQFRNGLMVAMLAFHPVRLGTFCCSRDRPQLQKSERLVVDRAFQLGD
jgi:hypothetical protein